MVWTVLIKPFKDELITSWLVRNAITMGVQPYVYAYRSFENPNTWKNDIDIRLNREEIQKLSSTTGFEKRLIRATTLVDQLSFFQSNTELSAHRTWILPINIRNTNKPRYGLQFCAQCLIEDGETPYYRKHWRLAFFTTCQKHQLSLSDKCNQCNSPVSLRKIQVRDDLIYKASDIVFCFNCGDDLRKQVQTTPNNSLLTFEKDIFHLYQNGYGKLGSLHFNYSNLAFVGMRRLLAFILCSPKGIKQKMNIDKTPHKSEPEHLSILSRQHGLETLSTLMDNWPQSLDTEFKNRGVTYHTLIDSRLTYPYWLYKQINTNLRHPTYSPNLIESTNAALYIQRLLGRRATHKELENTLGSLPTTLKPKNIQSQQRITQAKFKEIISIMEHEIRISSQHRKIFLVRHLLIFLLITEGNQNASNLLNWSCPKRTTPSYLRKWLLNKSSFYSSRTQYWLKVFLSINDSSTLLFSSGTKNTLNISLILTSLKSVCKSCNISPYPSIHWFRFDP